MYIIGKKLNVFLPTTTYIPRKQSENRFSTAVSRFTWFLDAQCTRALRVHYIYRTDTYYNSAAAAVAGGGVDVS